MVGDCPVRPLSCPGARDLGETPSLPAQAVAQLWPPRPWSGARRGWMSPGRGDPCARAALGASQASGLCQLPRGARKDPPSRALSGLGEKDLLGAGFKPAAWPLAPLAC